MHKKICPMSEVSAIRGIHGRPVYSHHQMHSIKNVVVVSQVGWMEVKETLCSKTYRKVQPGMQEHQTHYNEETKRKYAYKTALHKCAFSSLYRLCFMFLIERARRHTSQEILALYGINNKQVGTNQYMIRTSVKNLLTIKAFIFM